MIIVDAIGRFFIRLLSEFHTKKKDVPVDREHPSSLVLVRQMRSLRIRRYGAQNSLCRANQGCSGT